MKDNVLCIFDASTNACLKCILLYLYKYRKKKDILHQFDDYDGVFHLADFCARILQLCSNLLHNWNLLHQHFDVCFCHRYALILILLCDFIIPNLFYFGLMHSTYRMKLFFVELLMPVNSHTNIMFVSVEHSHANYNPLTS